MSTLLEQFVLESQEILQNLTDKILLLEKNPADKELIHELFRGVHTLKGNSGLFDFKPINHVLHRSEDLIVAIREGHISFSQEVADQLLHVIDFISMLVDEIRQTGSLKGEYEKTALELSQLLNSYVPSNQKVEKTKKGKKQTKKGKKQKELTKEENPLEEKVREFLFDIPEKIRIGIFQEIVAKKQLQVVFYHPEEECFFKGEDPFYLARNVPGCLWGNIQPRKKKLPDLIDFDCYRCFLDFSILTTATQDELLEHFKFIAEQVQIVQLSPYSLILPKGKANGGPVYADFVNEGLVLLEGGEIDKLKAAVLTLLDLSSPELWISSALRWLLAVLDLKGIPIEYEVIKRLLKSIESFEIPDFSDLEFSLEPSPQVNTSTHYDSERIHYQKTEKKEYLKEILEVIETQKKILSFPDQDLWFLGRLKSCYRTLIACNALLQEPFSTLDAAFKKSEETHSSAPLREWVESFLEKKRTELQATTSPEEEARVSPIPSQEKFERYSLQEEPELRFGRREEDRPGSRVLKVDQSKIDRLMNLVGELVIAKNSIPYLAQKVEKTHDLSDLSRELKALYTNMHRFSDEFQDIVMKLRMVPFSTVFQRFPRLVRDVSLKLEKKVTLVMEGESIEADKNILDALAEPLIHILRNSLDHGIEHPEEREKAGKPRIGTIFLKASQDSDRIILEIKDDGRGIDPIVVKRKAYEKGLIDEKRLETLSEGDAINLIFLSGFSTVDSATDLSGRGVGMDVVKNTLDNLGGSIEVQSVLGKGTLFKLSIPLSMAITNVMIVESNGQVFGVPMSYIEETIRIPEQSIRFVKNKKTTVVRKKIIPLFSLNELLEIPTGQKTNAESEYSVLVLRVAEDLLGLIVDDFREVVDIILKPPEGFLAKLKYYEGTSLLGDGSVLLVLNMKEIHKCL